MADSGPSPLHKFVRTMCSIKVLHVGWFLAWFSCSSSADAGWSASQRCKRIRKDQQLLNHQTDSHRDWSNQQLSIERFTNFAALIIILRVFSIHYCSLVMPWITNLWNPTEYSYLGRGKDSWRGLDVPDTCYSILWAAVRSLVYHPIIFRLHWWQWGWTETGLQRLAPKLVRLGSTPQSLVRAFLWEAQWSRLGTWSASGISPTHLSNQNRILSPFPTRYLMPFQMLHIAWLEYRS